MNILQGSTRGSSSEASRDDGNRGQEFKLMCLLLHYRNDSRAQQGGEYNDSSCECSSLEALDGCNVTMPMPS